MEEVKILRLSTGEDVIAKVGENDQGVSLHKSICNHTTTISTRKTNTIDDVIV